MNFQRYLYGIKAWFLCKITKNRIGIVSSGSIPRYRADWTGIIIEKKKLDIAKWTKVLKAKSL